MFQCLYIIHREFLVMYAKVTKLIKWKYLYKYKYFHFINSVPLAYIIRNSLWMMYKHRSM